MEIDNSKAVVRFEFSPSTHFLVRSRDERFGVNGGVPIYTWSLNPRIDRSYKGKDDDIAIPEIYLSDADVEACKKAGFTYIDDSDGYESWNNEKELELAIEEVSKEIDKPWFINSKGNIQKSGVPHSAKHQLRVKWGNSFKTKEEAVAKRLMWKIINNAEFEITNEKACN